MVMCSRYCPLACIVLQRVQAPDAPSAPQVTPLNGALNISWQPPAFASTISSYIIVENETSTVKEVSAVLGLSAYSWVLTGLNNGQTYTLSIRAMACTGPSSAAVVSGVPHVCAPGVVVNASIASAGANALRLTWYPPAGAHPSTSS